MGIHFTFFQLLISHLKLWENCLEFPRPSKKTLLFFSKLTKNVVREIKCNIHVGNHYFFIIQSLSKKFSYKPKVANNSGRLSYIFCAFNLTPIIDFVSKFHDIHMYRKRRIDIRRPIPYAWTSQKLSTFLSEVHGKSTSTSRLIARMQVT